MEENGAVSYYWIQNGQPKLMRMVLLSFIVHTLLISLVFAAPSFLKKKGDLHPLYMVRLVSPSDLGIKGSPTKVQKGVKKRRTKKASSFKDKKKAPTIRKRAEISGPRPIVLPKEESIPHVKRDLGAELEKIKRKIEEVKQQEEEPKEVQKGPFPTRPTPSSWRVQSTLLIEYSLVVKQRVKEGWSFPNTGETLDAIISLQVDRDGKLEDIRFEKRSGSPRFDDSILRALRKTILPPPPQGIIGEVFVITFHST